MIHIFNYIFSQAIQNYFLTKKIYQFIVLYNNSYLCNFAISRFIYVFTILVQCISLYLEFLYIPAFFKNIYRLIDIKYIYRLIEMYL